MHFWWEYKLTHILESKSLGLQTSTSFPLPTAVQGVGEYWLFSSHSHGFGYGYEAVWISINIY
jgi:hypothetical protein